MGNYYNREGFSSYSVPCKTNPAKINVFEVTFFVFEEGGIIRDFRWAVFGPPILMAAGSLVYERAINRRIEDVLASVSVKSLEEVLGPQSEYDGQALFGGLLEALDAALTD